MPETLKKLKLSGYYYDTESSGKLNSVFYTSEKSEDDWIKISKVSGGAYETYVITFVVDCEDTILKISAFDEDHPENFEYWLNGIIDTL
jgi:hypothetical protein